MIRHLAFITIAAVLCASCGEQKQAIDDSFKESFKRGFLSSCQSAAANSVSADVASKYCSCGLDKVVAQYSPSELAALGLDKVKPIMAQCAKDVGAQ